MADILPDQLRPSLRLVFCGTAPGRISALRAAYYAAPGNRFWPTLFETGLTPRRLRPDEYPELLAFGIGLTDLAKTVFGQDAELPRHAFDRARLIATLAAMRPGHLAFNGKTAASLFLGRPTGKLPYGPLPALPAYPPITVLPSTSGRAGTYWDAAPWHAMARAVG